MKRKTLLLTFAVASLLCGTLTAQTTINAGYLNSDVSATYNGNSYDVTPNMHNGFYVGAMRNFNLKGDVGVAVGANFQMLFASDTTASSLAGLASVSLENHYTQMAIEVPVLFNYGFGLNSTTTLKVFAGPTFNYGISSKRKWKTNANVIGLTASQSGEVDYYDNGDASLSRFNVALTVGASLDFEIICINAGYTHGLTDLYGTSDALKAHYDRWFVGLAFKL